MNTLMIGLLWLQVGQTPDAVSNQFEERAYTATSGESPRTMKYRLLKPEKVEAGKKYPAALFMHGAGERGDDNRKQLKYLPEWMAEKDAREKYACYLIVPQTNRSWAGRRAPADAQSTDKGASDKSTADTAPSLADAEDAVAMLRECIKEFPIDTTRLYVTGLSLGGYGCWATAAKYPDLFAAAAPICGGGDVAWAGRLKTLPIYAVHGDADPTVAIDQSRRMVEAVKTAGGNAKLKELPGVGHNSWTWAYRDPEGVLPWLFQQHK